MSDGSYIDRENIGKSSFYLDYEVIIWQLYDIKNKVWTLIDIITIDPHHQGTLTLDEQSHRARPPDPLRQSKVTGAFLLTRNQHGYIMNMTTKQK